MSRLFSPAAIVLALAAAPVHAGGVITDLDIAAAVAAVDGDHIQDTVEVLAAESTGGTRNSCSSPTGQEGEGITAARDFIAAQFRKIPGLEVRLDPFTHPSCPTAATFNVVAWLPGKLNPERLVVIGGHYDSRTVGVLDTTSPAPGANDSGSQTALVLEAARALAGHDFDATLVFVAFSGEEQGLHGSAALAKGLAKYFPDFRMIAMLNSDIVGGDNTVNGPAQLQQFRLYSPGTPRERTGRRTDGTTDNTSPARGVMRYVGTWGAAYVPSMEMLPKLREDRPGRGSDHTSFLNQAFPAVRFMETVECSPSPVDNSCGSATLPCPPPPTTPASCLNFNTSHQHSPADLTQFVTAEYMARITRLVASTAASLARAPSAPRDINVMGNNSEPRVNWNVPLAGRVHHYVIAARSTAENVYRKRVVVSGDVIGEDLSAGDLGFNSGESFFVSVAAVDKAGHESLFAYPEFRCDPLGCAIPPGALNVVVFE
jgi:hypothetical protein